MIYSTGIKATHQFCNILAGVIGQMSDGIWENTSSMVKYWKSLDYRVDSNDCLIIEDRYGICTNALDFFANKIKQIVKIEIEDGATGLEWSRTCSGIVRYMHGDDTTVGDCYKLYELLKGRSVANKKYATYSSYTVAVKLMGTRYELSVSALNPYDAQRKAKDKIMRQIDIQSVMEA